LPLLIYFSSIALCPFEAVKVRIQTTPSYARGMVDGLPKFASQEGLGSLYAGLGPLWARQVSKEISIIQMRFC
jgi:solute carrier family 25 phosphate transporter 3